MKSLTYTGIALGATLAIILAGFAAPSSESLAMIARLRRAARTTTPGSDAIQAPRDTRHQGPSAAPSATTYNGYVERAFIDAQGRQMTYYLYIPPLSDSTRYPIVLLLHGGGERALADATAEQNRDKLVNDSYVRVWSSAKVQSRWPSFILVPQVQGSNRWVNVSPHVSSYQLASTPSTSLALAKEILDWVEQEYASAIDPDRVYITGLSMGGFGVWDAIERWPQDFSAAAPISGAGDPSRAAALAHLPIWVFHGTLDLTVPVAASREMVAAIEAAGGHPLYTEYPNGNHVIWMQAYTSTDFLAWLFAQRTPT